MAPARLSKQRLRSEALLMRLVPVGEADAMVQLFTEQAGALSAIARGARRSSKRFSALEPMHLLRVSLDVSPVREIATLAEASLERPRIRLSTTLRPMQSAGQALRWLRAAAPDRTPEPRLWDEINVLLDALDDDASAGREHALVAAVGLRMLVAAGWGLVLDRCVRCGKPCPSRARTIIDVRAGGVVCRACGGVGPTVRSVQRRAMIAALAGDVAELGKAEDAELAITLVDWALEAHGRGEAT